MLKYRTVASILLWNVIASLPANAALFWPLDNNEYLKSSDIDRIFQSTENGDHLSGLFGNVREKGRRFHEGIDIKSQKRTARNIPADRVLSIMPGTIVYLNNTPSRSSYGRYLVVQHDREDISVYTLYAHLQKISPSLYEGIEVSAGAYLGVLGRTAGGYKIPLKRAHLHLEIGLLLTDKFQKWYDKEKFDSRNHHGIWNGMNLVGLDPVHFFKSYHKHGDMPISTYIKSLPVAFELLVPSSKQPNFLKRYPKLLATPTPGNNLTAWKIKFTWYGLPVQWTAVTTQSANRDIKVLHFTESRIPKSSGRRMLSIKNGQATVSNQLKQYLKLLFQD